MKEAPSCRCCGKCCFVDMVAYAQQENYDRWRAENRQDILEVIENRHLVWAGDRMISSETGDPPPALTLKTLLKPHGSYPRNPLVVEPLYLTKYIERMGTGIRDMVERCRAVGLSDPQFTLTDGFVITIKRKPELAFKAVGGTTGEVTGEVKRLLAVLKGDMKRTEIQAALALRHEDYFREAYPNLALNSGLIEMTVPEKPKSSKQKYRLTEKGKAVLAYLRKRVSRD